MTAPALLDVARLSRAPQDTEAPLWWGFAAMILIESTVFACLIASYFYLRFGNAQWPPAGIEPPALLLPTINTVVLLASSLVMHWADTGIRGGDRRRLERGLGVAVLLILVFLTLKAVEYGGKDYHWDDHAYGSIVWGIVGFHSLHVFVLMLKTIVIMILAWSGAFTAEKRLGVTVNGFYYHFVALVWLPLYAVLYLSPRL